MSLSGSPFDGDDVRDVAFLEDAQAVVDAQKLGGLKRRSLNGLHGRHAGLDHIDELLGVHAVRRNAGVGAESDLDASAVGFGEGLLDERSDRRGLRANDGGKEAVFSCLFRHPFSGENGGHVIRSGAHEKLDNLAVHVCAVLDRGDARFERALHTLGAVGVNRDREAVVFRRRDHGLELRYRELGVLPARPERQYASSTGQLDEIGTLLVALANRLERVFGAVDDAVFWCGVAHKLPLEAVGGVAMSAGGGEGLGRSEDPRPFDPAAANRVAERDGNVIAIADVAYGRKAGHQRALRVLGRA